MASRYGFEISGIEPIDIEHYGEHARREFWKAVVVLTLIEKDSELAKGRDIYGDKLTPISPYTRAHRRSWTGKADPNAPPLIPAYRQSRTRVLLDGRALRNKAEFFWRADPVTGRPWGRVLGWHREGAGYLPERDVIGLSPKSLARIKAAANKAWLAIRRGESAPKKKDVIGRLNVPKPELLKPKPKPKKATTTTTTRRKAEPKKTAPFFIYLKPGQKPSRTSRGAQIYEVPDRPEAVAARPEPAPAPKPKPTTRPRPKLKPAPAPAVAVTTHGNPEEWAVDNARQVVKDLPAKVQQTLAAHGTSVAVGKKVTDVAPHLTGQRPRGWKEGETWDNADGVYLTRARTATIAETYVEFETGKTTTTTRFHGVLRHEIGHAFDHALGNHSETDPAFKAAYEADVKAHDREAVNNLGYYRQAGSDGRSEAFAEVFAQVVGKTGSSRVSLAAYFPRLFALIVGLLA